MIEFSHVAKSYPGGFSALSDISFFVDKGAFVFLTGASGAGKTTLLKHIYMEETPTSGQVFVCGYDSTTITRQQIPLLRRKLGIVFQDFKLLDDRNVFENVAFAMRVTGASERKIKRKVFEVLSLTGLSHKCANYPHQLSGGEQQRVSIARAIVNNPWILLADEPTGNLDWKITLEIFKLIQTINSWGTTILFATHDMHLMDSFHYRKLELTRGTLVGGNDFRTKPKWA